MPQIPPEKIRWNLTSLYTDLDDEKLQEDLSRCSSTGRTVPGPLSRQAQQFRNNTRELQ